MSTTFNFPVVITSAGLQPVQPTSFLSQLLAYVASKRPGYTGDLPASLVEDISSTDIAAVALIDQARVDLVNSLTPAGANNFLLDQLGQVYGVTLGEASNTYVNVVFSGTVGFVVNAGFQVSDGTYTYQLQEGGVIGGSGISGSLTAIATQSGSWAVAPGTVTQIVTSYPSSITLSVTNPTAGTPGGNPETAQSFRARVMQAGLASSQGMPRYMKTLIQNLPGVVPRLVAVQATLGTGIKVICGGGDNYQIANAIFQSIFDPSALIASTTHPTSNVYVSINDYPDVYQIVFVSAVEQVVTINLTWNTTLADFTQGSAVDQIVVQPLADVVNAIPVGAPLNILDLNSAFIEAVSSILDQSDISKMDFSITVDGSPVTPTNYIISSDLESYFSVVTTAITVTQG